MTARYCSFTDTLGIWHSLFVHYATYQGFITAEGDSWRRWCKTKHGTYWLDPKRYDTDEFDYCCRLLGS